MRAALLATLGDLPRLGTADKPQPQEGQALVEIAAVALNPIDVAIGSGRFFGGHPPLPYVPGCEGVGRVLSAHGLAPGARVYLRGDGIGLHRDGTLQEQVAVAEDSLLTVPDGVSDELAVACGIAGLAGFLPLSWRAPVRPDDRVLVLGASGAVGAVAVQAARALGASRVVAAGRDPRGLERARRLGADATVRIEEGADLATAFRDAAGGGGPTLIVDPLWGAPLAAALEAAAPRARIVQLGQSAGAQAPLASAPIRGKGLELLGFTVFLAPQEVTRQAYAELLGHVMRGAIELELESASLERIDELWRRQVEGPDVKLVVRL